MAQPRAGQLSLLNIRPKLRPERWWAGVLMESWTEEGDGEYRVPEPERAPCPDRARCIQGNCQSFRMNECRKWFTKKKKKTERLQWKAQPTSGCLVGYVVASDFILRAGFSKV